MREHHQGPFVTGNDAPTGGPFSGGPERRPRRTGTRVGMRILRFLWRHLKVNIIVAAIGLFLVFGLGAFDDGDSERDASNRLEEILPNYRGLADGVDVPEITPISEQPHASEDPAEPGASELVRVLAVGATTVRVRTLLQRELTWQVASPTVRQRLLATAGTNAPVFVTWGRDGRGRPLVTEVLTT